MNLFYEIGVGFEQYEKIEYNSYKLINIEFFKERINQSRGIRIDMFGFLFIFGIENIKSISKFSSKAYGEKKE